MGRVTVSTDNKRLRQSVNVSDLTAAAPAQDAGQISGEGDIGQFDVSFSLDRIGTVDSGKYTFFQTGNQVVVQFSITLSNCNTPANPFSLTIAKFPFPMIAPFNLSYQDVYYTSSSLTPADAFDAAATVQTNGDIAIDVYKYNAPFVYTGVKFILNATIVISK
jgi:hypothetical protein